MIVFEQSRHYPIAVLLSVTLLISGCSDKQPNSQLNAFNTAVRAGDLDAQAEALKTIVQQGQGEKIPHYQMLLEDINVVRQLNQRAVAKLKEDKFAALDIAISADNKRPNKASKAIITGILKPYLYYYHLKPFMQQWAYPSVNKVVVKGLMPNPLAPWGKPLSIPAVWPDTKLIKLLQTPNTDVLRQFPKFVQEHQQWLEIDRLGARLYQQNTQAQYSQQQWPKIAAFYQDIVNINQMYNTIVSDLRYYYLSQAIDMAEQQVTEQLEAVESSLANVTELNDVQITLDQITQDQITEDRQSDWQNLKYCCQNHLKILTDGFSYLANDDSYTKSITAINQRWTKWAKDWSINLQTTDGNVRAAMPDKPKVKLSLQQWQMRLIELQQQLATIEQDLAKTKALHLQVPRATIGHNYLQTSYRWHQGDFGAIDALSSQLGDYHTTLTQK